MVVKSPSRLVVEETSRHLRQCLHEPSEAFYEVVSSPPVLGTVTSLMSNLQKAQDEEWAIPEGKMAQGLGACSRSLGAAAERPTEDAMCHGCAFSRSNSSSETCDASCPLAYQLQRCISKPMKSIARHQNDIPIDLSQRVTRFLQHAPRLQLDCGIPRGDGYIMDINPGIFSISFKKFSGP